MEELIRLENVSKTFPGVRALKEVDISILKGEVHGLVGENGAGKSTLIKIITGAHQMDKDGGQMFWKGKSTIPSNPQEAKRLGIGAVYQDVMMAPHLTVGENFFMGKLPKKGGIVDWKTMFSVTQKTLDELGIKVKANTRVDALSVAMQEMVAIAKVFYDHSELVIFDEPTALLTNEEVDLLKTLIFKLRDSGCGIIYISHRLEEIFSICSRATVLRDGEYVGTVNVADITNDDLVSMMCGRKVENQYEMKQKEIGEVALEVRNLTSHDGGNTFRDISFQVKKGEILGFYGLVGSGRTDIMRAIIGADKFDSGEIYVHGEPTTMKQPYDSNKEGIAFCTENRKLDGLGMNLSIRHNINMASYRKISKAGIINTKIENQRARELVNTVGIITPSIEQLVYNLSGGNQQKVVIGKWLASDSDIFIFDEPTVGVDVGARREIYSLIEELIEKGAAIVIISSYLPEVMGLSDRIIVMHEGAINGSFIRKDYIDDMDESVFLKKASGL